MGRAEAGLASTSVRRKMRCSAAGAAGTVVCEDMRHSLTLTGAVRKYLALNRRPPPKSLQLQKVRL